MDRVHGNNAPHGQGAARAQSHRPYLRLLLSLGVSYAVMFAVMFARVNTLDNVYASLNQAWMAGLMVAPMLLIMLATMRSMFHSAALNIALAVAGVALIALFWGLIRTQGGIGDTQFLRSMISHHAGAILVCERASLSDERVRRLCGQIIESQQREIAEMKQLLDR